MQKHLMFAVISFAVCALGAGHQGAQVLKTFAMGQNPQINAHQDWFTCFSMIVCFLGAIVLPVIGVIMGVGEELAERKKG